MSARRMLVPVAAVAAAVAAALPAGASPNGGGPAATVAQAPEVGKTVVVERDDGTVKVRRRGSRRWQRLTGSLNIPVDSEVDATRGSVTVFAAGGDGVFHTGTFSGGRFQIHQVRVGSLLLAELRLLGGRTSCTQSDIRRKRARRRLNASASGVFQLRGFYATALNRNESTYSVTDRCDGTLARVGRRPTTARVEVRNTATNRTVRLSAGKQYLAKPRRAR